MTRPEEDEKRLEGREEEDVVCGDVGGRRM